MPTIFKSCHGMNWKKLVRELIINIYASGVEKDKFTLHIILLARMLKYELQLELGYIC